MMPVVDAGATLSLANYTLNDYSDDASCFHALRMVAVQRSPDHSVGATHGVDQAMEELKSFQQQAMTRGSGGLPNAIVAYADLNDTVALQTILDCQGLHNLRGIHHELKHTANMTAEHANTLVASWCESIALVTEHQLSVDLTASISSSAILEAFALGYPDVDLVVNVVIAGNSDTNENEQWQALMVSLAEYKRVYFKFSCSNMGVPVFDFASMLHRAISILGAERILLASGLNEQANSCSFKLKWHEFIGAAEPLTARQRDKVFRSNAIGVYNL